MTRTSNTLLLIDHDPRHATALEEALIVVNDSRLSFEWTRTLSRGIERLVHGGIWAIFLNLFLPDSGGVRTLDTLLSVSSSVPVVILGGVGDENLCKVGMQHGAQDYLLEGHIDSYLFGRAIRNIIERDVARHELFVERERAQVTLNSIGDAVLSTDISGKVTYLNVVAEHMTGWSRAELLVHRNSSRSAFSAHFRASGRGGFTARAFELLGSTPTTARATQCSKPALPPPESPPYLAD
jgi:PAS domain-containing protein